MTGENELPEGWVACQMGDISEVIAGGTPNTKNLGNFIDDGIPWITPADLSGFKEIYISRGQRSLSIKGFESSSARLMPKGTVLMSSRAPIGYIAIALNQISTNQGFKNFICYEGILPEYVYFWIKFQTPLIESMGSGSTFKEVSGSRAKTIPIIIPPLAEQRRIVAAIEALLVKVNVSRERLDRVPGLLNAFRQAVLEAACSGKLTETWRENSFLGNNHHQEIPFGWKLVKVEEVCHSRLGKMLDKSKNRGEFVPYLRNINVRWFDFDFSDIKTIRATQSEIENLTLRKGDLLVCEGGEPGRCAIWRDDDKSFIYQKALHRLRVKDDVIPEWICYCLKNAADSGRLSDLFTGSTIKHLTGVSLKEFSFLLPPLPEQHEIVHRVESLFALADHIEQRVATGKEHADRLTQAILAKAFRGELVPTEAELAKIEGRKYEPGSALLEKINAQKGFKSGKGKEK
ncbi:type I restriction enzyme S subunit [Methanolinea mesophila]|uniref:restriction endonuclease subunit S n=1 Tax=Methanolinea mesophila TaxID=547055 RepID=UPI001AEABFFE|nr:restriction endonuclease subunit S [Methanolinea mesophila]MBP1927705.1 type I restriction enzyme S subunit [Methanolinea mesophila]